MTGYKNDVVRYAADMQTQSTEKHDNNHVFTSQRNAVVTINIINNEKKSQICNVYINDSDHVTSFHMKSYIICILGW